MLNNRLVDYTAFRNLPGMEIRKSRAAYVRFITAYDFS